MKLPYPRSETGGTPLSMGLEDLQRSVLYEIGDLTLDVGQCRLRRARQLLTLTKLNFLVLRCLVEAAPNVVSHAKLTNAVWGTRRIITQENVGKRIMLLRQTLGDSAEHPRYIEAVRGLGYRIVAPVRRIDGTAETATAADSSPAAPTTRARAWASFERRASIAAAFVVVVAAAAWWYTDADESARGVLPFIDRSSTGHYEYTLSGDPLGSADFAEPFSRPAVYAAYLQARHIHRNLIAASLPHARTLLERAVADDPDYFPARRELIASYNILHGAGLLDRAEVKRLLRVAIDDAATRWPKRVEIDFWRGWYALKFEDLGSAARHFQRALRAPAHLDTLPVLVDFSMMLNRLDDAIAIGEYLLERDPTCFFCYHNLMVAYYRAQRYDKVGELYFASRALGFEHPALTLVYGLALLELNEVEEALRQFDAVDLPSVRRPLRLAAYARAYWALNRRSEFDSAIAELRELEPIGAANVYALTGNLAAAFAIYDEQPKLPPELFDGSVGDAMREHERWPDLARKAQLLPRDRRDDVRFDVSLLQ